MLQRLDMLMFDSGKPGNTVQISCLYGEAKGGGGLSRKIRKWSAGRKFNFGEIANFQAPRPPANIRPPRIEQAGGAE
ncbi:hypothetical protein [Cedecea davisae]|uniref:hypothetical protein n=1 Tax=Cedecea davisae TaxID=158484 RepID=UPI00209E49A0|nr:hypothetical protein [Cedecea davisae]